MNPAAADHSHDRDRDAGLVRRIGPGALAASFVGIMLGAGLFTIPRDMAAAVGPLAPLAYLACAVFIGAVMICFAEASARVPTSGGPYGFAAAAFGPYVGWLTGALGWASAVTGTGGVAAAAADAAASVVPGLAAGSARGLVIVAWFAVLAAVNIAGVGIMARFVAGMTIIKVLPLLLFVGVGACFIDPVLVTAPIAGVAGDFGRAAILGIFLFTGIEAGLGVSGEVTNPSRTIPRAIGLSLAGYAAICIAVQLVAQGLLGNALATAPAPLADAMQRISPALGGILILGTIVSMLGYNAADALASPRMLFAFARDGLLPAPVARLTRQRRVPAVAVILHCSLGAALAVSGSFAALAVLATLIVVLVYLIGVAAALKLRRDKVETAGRVSPIALLPVAAVVAVAAMLWVGAQSTRAEALAILAYVGLLTLLYRFRRRPAG